MNVYPLIFQPILKPKLWGGRRLEDLLQKSLPRQEPIGESWELADLEDDQSLVANGPAKGRSLRELVALWGERLYGGAPLVQGRFPLLLKFLDAGQTLSVQVHPSDAVARRRGGHIRVKHEAWYIVDAAEDGCIYRGLKPGVTVDDLRRCLTEGSVEGLLARIPVRKGHCYYLPSGTLHALGAGVVVAEVQTPSDTTFRVFDWNRIDPATGEVRSLHIDEALECVSLSSIDPAAEKPQHLVSVWTSVTSLVRCDSFVIERVRMAEGVDQPIPYCEFVAWMVLEGAGTITCDGLDTPVEFRRGDTVLLPAALKNGRVRTDQESMWLEISYPVPSSLRDFERPQPQPRRASDQFVPLNVQRPPDQS